MNLEICWSAYLSVTVDITKCMLAFSPESLSNRVNFVTKIVTAVKFN